MPRFLQPIRRVLTGYGMLSVLAILCVFFSVATMRVEQPTGHAGAMAVDDSLGSMRGRTYVIVTQSGAGDSEFANELAPRLSKRGFTAVGVFAGDPPSVGQSLRGLPPAPKIDYLFTTPQCRSWAVLNDLGRLSPALALTRVSSPPAVRRSTFLSPSNLRNVADQISVIAIIAVGMTMVIITGGIDLSVGSLIALSAVGAAWMIQRGGGTNAGFWTLFGCCLAAVALCGLVGAFSGLVITRFNVPPFIATLAVMQVASGLAFIIAQGQSIYDIPPSFTWLGRGADIFALPNAALLMLIVYVAAHVIMTRTATGRHIYAVGGSAESARLSGINIRRTIIFVYVASALMAGLGGVITASQLKAGAPTYGVMYELYVIAAVVVGGTSLSGGEGRIFGTLIGAFIIAVIRNGMNLMDVEPYTQKVILGLVILGAVLLDRMKRRAWVRERS